MAESSCNRRLPRSSVPGTGSARWTTGTSTRSPTTSGPPRTCRRWSSGTWDPTPERALRSPETLRPEGSNYSGSSCRTPRARMSSRELNASPGAAAGFATFDPDEAERMGRDEKKPVVLVRVETSPDDVHGILHSKGVLTARGGATSHAAVVTRGLGIPCVTGCESIVVDYDEGLFRVGGKVVHRGDFVSIDGSSGEVFEGRIPTIDPDFQKETDLQTLLRWADEERRLQVWANADYPRDAERARAFGAQGIGLDRTEHMFMETDRLGIVHEMLVAVA